MLERNELRKVVRRPTSGIFLPFGTYVTLIRPALSGLGWVVDYDGSEHVLSTEFLEKKTRPLIQRTKQFRQYETRTCECGEQFEARTDLATKYCNKCRVPVRSKYLRNQKPTSWASLRLPATGAPLRATT